MKKLIAILLILSCITILVSCDKEPVDDGKALETAETFIQVTGNAVSIDLDEDVVRTLLEVYSVDSLGLSKEIYDYDLKLSATRFMDNDACLVEAFLEDEQTPEGTFVILGQQCFVYNKKTQEYLLLTPDGAVKLNESSVSGENLTTTKPAFQYNEENNQNLQDKFSSYSKDKLGLEKELSEYVLVVPGTTTVAENGEKVFVIRLYEKSGKITNNTLAFNENGNYVFDYETNKYIKL